METFAPKRSYLVQEPGKVFFHEKDVVFMAILLYNTNIAKAENKREENLRREL
jgi:hypothetical protein